MSELIPPSSEIFTPGEVIEFSNSSELHQFEDLVADSIESKQPAVRRQMWDTRKPLIECVRPPKFYGRIEDIKMRVMDKPYEHLLNLIEAGTPGLSRNLILRNEYKELTSKRYVGFEFFAAAKKFNGTTISQIQSNIWYYPTGLYKKLKNPRTGYSRLEYLTGDGPLIHRVFTKPKMETEKFIELDTVAKSVGFVLLQENMTHPTRANFSKKY